MVAIYMLKTNVFVVYNTLNLYYTYTLDYLEMLFDYIINNCNLNFAVAII